MRLFETTDEEIVMKIVSLKKSNCTKDIISSNACKVHANSLAPILSTLINECFLSGTFPNSLKCSRIVPIHKEGDPLLPTNYRPINLLPSMAKIFESCMIAYTHF